MVLPLLIAGAGMLASGIGNSIGARSYQKQLDREAAAKAAMDAQRRGSIRTALAEASPAAQYARAHDEAQVYRGQQDENQAIGRAYGLDNPALSDAIAANGQTINDRAWQRAFGITGSDVGHALGDETQREHSIDNQEAWWQAFMQNRLQRAGAKGDWLRFLGKAATATGLGFANRGMAAEDTGDGWTAEHRNAVNGWTGENNTRDLQDRSWLWGTGSAQAAPPARGAGMGGPFYWPIGADAGT